MHNPAIAVVGYLLLFVVSYGAVLFWPIARLCAPKRQWLVAALRVQFWVHLGIGGPLLGFCAFHWYKHTPDAEHLGLLPMGWGILMAAVAIAILAVELVFRRSARGTRPRDSQPHV